VWIGRGAVARAAVTANPTQVVLGPTNVGQNDTATTTLSADTTTTVTLQLGNGDCNNNQFSVSPNGQFTIGPADNQTVTVTFSPNSGGAKICTINVRSGGSTIASFTAVGNAPVLSVVVPSGPLAFGDVEVGVTATPQTVTVRNTGSATLNFTSAGFTANGGDYVLTGTTPATLAPNQSTSWTIACRPTARSTRNGNFRVVSDSVLDTTTDVGLTCNGLQGVLTLGETSHNFGGVAQGSTATFDVTLQNTGNVAIRNLAAAFSDTTKGYALMTAIPAGTGLAIGETRTVTVVFAPQSGNDGGP